MKLYYYSRARARAFARKNAGYKFRDEGNNAPAGRRWAVVFAESRRADSRQAA